MNEGFRDRQGNPLTLLEWAEKFELGSYALVAKTLLEDVYVSTTWTGIVMPGDSIPPCIFVTYVFGGDDDGQSGRYTNEAAAFAGHAAIVRQLRQAREARGQDHR